MHATKYTVGAATMINDSYISENRLIPVVQLRTQTTHIDRGTITAHNGDVHEYIYDYAYGARN